MQRRLAAAFVALGLGFGGVLLGAMPAASAAVGSSPSAAVSVTSSGTTVEPAATYPTYPPTAPPRERRFVLDPNWTFRLDGLDLSNIRPGDTFTIAAEGLPAGLSVTVELHSDPVVLVTTTVGRDGITAHALPHDRLLEAMTRYGRPPRA